MSCSRLHSQLEKEQSELTLFAKAQSHALDYLQNQKKRPVTPSHKDLEQLSKLVESMPTQGCAGETILDLLHTIGSPATSVYMSGRYFGFVNGGVLPIALAARHLADYWDQNPGLYVMSPIAAQLEMICERWLIELFGLSDDSCAGFVSGSSNATFCALAAARYRILHQLGWDIQSQGLCGAPQLRLIVSAEIHNSVIKAISLLGLGTDCIERVPVDDQGRAQAALLPPLDEHCIVVLQAGNVCSGAFDYFSQIAPRVREAGAWLHIDGAFGLWAAASPTHSHLTRGMEAAHSYSLDGHKTLNTPYDNGIVLCQDAVALKAAMSSSASYLPDSGKRDGMHYTADMSRRCRSAELWAALKYLGKEGVSALVDGLCERAQQFAERLDQSGWNIENEVVFNQVLISCDEEEVTRKVMDLIQHSGECWMGGALWREKFVIRISVCSWTTTAADVERSCQALINARKTVLEQR